MMMMMMIMVMMMMMMMMIDSTLCLQVFTPHLVKAIDQLVLSQRKHYMKPLALSTHQSHQQYHHGRLKPIGTSLDRLKGMSSLDASHTERGYHYTDADASVVPYAIINRSDNSSTMSPTSRSRHTIINNNNNNNNNSHQSPPSTPTPSSSSSSSPPAVIIIEHNHVLLMQLQHERLYPDRKIDLLPDSGIIDVRSYSSDACINITSMLSHMAETISRKKVLNSMFDSLLLYMGSIRWMFISSNYSRSSGSAAAAATTSPANKHVQRLHKCIEMIVQLVPEASVGVHKINTNTDHEHTTHTTAPPADPSLASAPSLSNNILFDDMLLSTDRDLYTGKLTTQTKTKLLNGSYKCDIKDLLETKVLTTDPLDTPICSYEWRFLAIKLINYSKHFNSYYQLPRNQHYIMCTWGLMYRKKLQAQYGSEPHLLQQLWVLYEMRNIIVQTFRINLRYFSRYSVVYMMMWLMMILLYMIHLISTIYLFTITVAIVMLIIVNK